MSESDLFQAAVKLPAAVRAAFLDQACGADAALRLEVEAILSAHEQPGAFMHRPAIADATTTYGPGPERPGMRIGPYKLLQFLGEGGMGTVFLAEQTEPVRRMVALKIIKPGMDSSQVLARFEAERQALALMDHPNIAKVFEAGTIGEPGASATGACRPYFVMELVKGVPLTEFCDKNKLTTRQRLELFIPVCQAIQHAHMKGIIHRDVKPSNVLVALYDGKPVPKVIDFGVAKAMAEPLTRRTLFTQIGQIVGTFEYMSPEQATLNQLDVDTRSDIYSLGVLLYEMMTGTTPIDKVKLRSLALDQMLRAIREEEPPRPSARLSSSPGVLAMAAAYRGDDSHRLAGQLRGELDWIVMKCLEKERDRRFVTAGSLAQDIQRYLNDEPVEACPPSLAYRLKKSLRKYRKPVAVAALLLIMLVAGIIASTWQAIRATRAEDQALHAQTLAERAEEKAVKDRDTAKAALDQLQQVHRRLEAAQDDNRRALYHSRVRSVQAAWEADDMARVRELLAITTPQKDETDHRGFEWFYWNRQAHRELSSIDVGQLCGGKTPRATDVSADGRFLAALVPVPQAGNVADATGENNPLEVRIWDIAAARLHATLPLPFTKKVNIMTLRGRIGLTFSPDGSRLVCGRRVVELTSKRKFGYLGVTLAENSSEAKIAKVAGPAQMAGLQVDDVILQVGALKILSREAMEQAMESFKGDDEINIKVMRGQDILDIKATLWLNPSALLPQLTRDPRKHLIDWALWDVGTGKVLFAESQQLTSTNPLPAGTMGLNRPVFDGSGAQVLLREDGMKPRLLEPSTGKVTEVGLDTPKTGSHPVVLDDRSPRMAFVHCEYAKDDSLGLARPIQQDIKVWDLAHDNELLSIPWPRETTDGDRPSVICLAFNPQGDRLALMTHQGTILVWDLKTNKEHLRLSPSNIRTFGGNFDWNQGQLTFSPDGKWLAGFCRDRRIWIWDAATGQLRQICKGHVGQVDKFAFTRDGHRLCSLGHDGRLKTWDVTGRDHTPPPQADRPALKFFRRASAVNAAGTRILLADQFRDVEIDGEERFTREFTVQITVYDASWRELLKLPLERTDLLEGVQFLGDGRLVAGWNRLKFKLWRSTTGEVVYQLDLRGTRSVCISPDGRFLATSHVDGVLFGASVPTTKGPVVVRDLATGKEIFTLADKASEVVFSPDGRRLASRGSRVKIWDTDSGKELLTLPEGVRRVLFIAGGKRFITAESTGEKRSFLGQIADVAEVTVRDAATGEVLRTLGRSLVVRSTWLNTTSGMVASADGTLLATSDGDGDKGSIAHVWDLATGKEVCTLSGHAAPIGSLAISPDGRRIATWAVSSFTDKQSETKIWDVATGRELLSFNHGGGFTSRGNRQLAFSSDGQRLLFNSRDVQIWDGSEVK